MTRLTIRFRAEEYARAENAAKVLGVSLAEFVRAAVRDKLSRSEEAPWMQYAGMVASRDPNSSLFIDEIVYGSKK